MNTLIKLITAWSEFYVNVKYYWEWILLQLGNVQNDFANFIKYWWEWISW